MKQDFIVSELWILSWDASVRRASLYKENSKESERTEFRKDIISFISQDILPAYTSQIAEIVHENNIQLLTKQGSKIGSDVLGPLGYKIGISQKLLNLQLKYLWCLDLVAEPPHCPVDRIMINKTELRGTVNWTGINDIHTYKRVIAALKKKANPTGLSLSTWELSIYNRRNA